MRFLTKNSKFRHFEEWGTKADIETKIRLVRIAIFLYS